MLRLRGAAGGQCDITSSLLPVEGLILCDDSLFHTVLKHRHEQLATETQRGEIGEPGGGRARRESGPGRGGARKKERGRTMREEAGPGKEGESGSEGPERGRWRQERWVWEEWGQEGGGGAREGR